MGSIYAYMSYSYYSEHIIIRIYENRNRQTFEFYNEFIWLNYRCQKKWHLNSKSFGFAWFNNMVF